MIKSLKEYAWPYALGLVVFFAFVHYRGYDCDAALYLLQVMHYLQPERFINDVPFMFGNQDSFSIFSPIVTIALRAFGVDEGGIVTTLFLQLTLATSITILVYKWTKKFGEIRWALPTVLVMFILLADKEYGPEGFYLPMLESFLVARLPSQIFTIVGLAFLFDKKRYISLFFFVLSSVFHPLMGGWGFILWLFFFYQKTRLPMLVLALLAPLSGFLHWGRLDFYSADWNPIFFRPGWNDFCLYFSLLLFWFAMYRYFKGRLLSQFALAIFLTSLLGFYLQFAGSYMEHELLFQAQPFRVQWLCAIPAIPFFSLYVYDCLKERCFLSPKIYAGLVLGLCVIAGVHWFAILIICAIMIYTPEKKICQITAYWEKIIFILAGFFLLCSSMLCNYIILTLEQGIGNANLALAWLNLPDYLITIEKVFYIILALIFFSKKKYGYSLTFAIAFCNDYLRFLPLVVLLLSLIPNLGILIKKSLFSFAISYSFFELLSSLYRRNSSEILPLEGAPLASLILLVTFFISAFCFLSLKEKVNSRYVVVPLLFFVVSLGSWDVYRWDSRNATFKMNEKQMDSFFKETIFPQVKNRGQILFAVDNETPTQSRINFLTGAYADKSINVGEVFYKEQYLESNRRRSILLRGDSIPASMTDFNEKIMNVYSNKDTLLARVRSLCKMKEITHFVTDCANMPLLKEDTATLYAKNVYLYRCEK